MEEELKKELLQEYSNRHTNWTQYTLTQFGYSINLFTTICIGFIGYLISQRNDYSEIILSFNSNIHWDFFFYIVTIVFVFLSILLGFTSILSRLYDLRLTRHITRIRKKVLKDKDEMLNNEIIDSDNLKLKFFVTFLKILFCEIEFVKEKDFKNLDSLKLKFIHIREVSVLLGKYSWIVHKLQILLFTISVIIYGLNVII